MFYDNYGLFAIGSFDSIPYNESVTYKVYIYKKNYDNPFADPDTDSPGSAKSLTFGANPLVLRTLNDEVFGIKGSELELTLLNIDNQTPLSQFYSEEDDSFKVRVKAIYGGGTIKRDIFWGYMVQEDSSEVLTDFAHEIKLTFTDGLGTLKYVSFGEAAKWSPKSTTDLRVVSLSTTLEEESVNSSAYLKLNSNQNVGSPAANDYVILMNSPIGYASYQIKSIYISPTNPLDKRLLFTEKVNSYGPSTTKIAYVTGSDPLTRIKLADVIRICLHACNLNLDVYFGNSITVVKESTEYVDILNNVYIDGRTFLQDENNWKDCYEVLNEIMVRFQCSIFQSEGRWYIVRWNELRNFNNQIPFRRYDGYLSYIENVYYFAQTLDDVETGFDQTFLRPFNFYREILNYKSTNDLLYNRQGKILGLKENEYSGTYNGNSATVKEYEWDGWQSGSASGNIFNPIIRIYYATTGEILDRNMVILPVSGGNLYTVDPQAVIAKTIECKKGDQLKFSFEIKSKRNAGAPTSIGLFRFKLSNGTSSYYIENTQEENFNVWSTDPDAYSVTQTYLDWRNIEVYTKEMPIDGLFTFYLPYFNFSGALSESYIRNIEFEYIPATGMQNIVNGHQHNAKQNQIIKNNQINEIFIDDTTKNSVNGTLFFNAFQNLIQVRTGFWKDGQIIRTWQLGEITTRQMEDWRYKIRIKLEGKILGVINSVGDYMMLYRAVIFDAKAGKYFIFGKATYDFKEDFIEATLYEMWDSTESRSGTGIMGNSRLTYEFKYLYK